MPLLQL